jgi:hypothetical protein
MFSLLTPPVRIMKPINNNNAMLSAATVQENKHVHKFETDNKRFAAVVIYDESPDGHCVVMNQAIRWRSFGKEQEDDDEFETKWNREVFLLDGTFV